MTLSNKHIIIGTGRHAAEVYYLISEIGILDKLDAFAADIVPEGGMFMNKKVWLIADLLKFYQANNHKPSVLVAIGDNESNKRLTSLFNKEGFPFFNAIHPSIQLNRQQFIGKGVTIAQGCILTCNISIGDYSIINIGCTISHDCVIGKNVNISPGCHLSGNVTVEDDVFMGTGVNVIPKIRIGKGSIIAAGACIIKDVPSNTMVAGVPGIIKKSLVN